MPNKKRNNRKKSTKQPSATTTAPTQVSELPVNVISVAATGGLEGAPTTTDSAPLPDFIQASIDNAVGSRAVDIDSIISQNTKQHSSTPVGNSTANATSLNKTLNDASATTDSAPLPDFIQTSIDNAVGSRVVDIDSIISSVGQKVSNGDYKEKPKETSSTTPKATSAVSASSGTTNTSKLSDAVEYAIQSVVQSPVVDAYKISHGSQSENTTGSQNVPESAAKDLKTVEKSVSSGSKDSNAAATEQNESTPKESAAKDLKNIEKSIDSDARATESNVSGQPKEAAAKDLKTAEKSIESESKENKSTDQKKKDNVGERKTSSEHKQTSSTDPNESKPPAAPPKTGDNVQKKNKSSEHKKSNFLKKKDCIIL